MEPLPPKTPRSGSGRIAPPSASASSRPTSTVSGGGEPGGGGGGTASVVAAVAAAKLKEHVRVRREGPYGVGTAPVPERGRKPPPSLRRLPTENLSNRTGTLDADGLDRGSSADPKSSRAQKGSSVNVSPKPSLRDASNNSRGTARLERAPTLDNSPTAGSGASARTSGVVYASAFNGGKRPFEPPDIEAVLTDLPLFGACSQQLLASLAESCKVREVPAGEDIVLKGDPAHGIIVVLKGLAVLQIGSSTCGRIPRGGCFGETHLLGLESHWSATMLAEVFTTVAELSREDFLQACEPHADVSKWYESIKKGGLGHVSEGVVSNTCELFQGLCQGTLLEIDQQTTTRVYFPGEVMVGQGERSEEFCIMVMGRAAVQVAGKTVRELDRARAKTPVCFGEPGLFGLRNPKGTAVLARSVCLVRVVYRTVFLEHIAEKNDFLASDRVNKLISKSSGSSPKAKAGGLDTSYLHLFQDMDCSPAFQQFISDNLEVRIFLVGTTIIDETSREQEPCMFSLILGSAAVNKQEQEVLTLKGGSHYGAQLLLGLDPDRSAVVVAKETCHVEVLHQSVIVRAMELYPEDREKVLASALKQMKETRKEEERAISSEKPPKSQAPAKPESHSALLSEFLTAPFFEGMSLECLEKISSVAQTQLFLPGENITEQGEPGDSMFIIVSGAASVLVRSDPDSQVSGVLPLNTSPFKQAGRSEKQRMNKVQELKPGSVFGELAMLGIMHTRAATVQAEALSSLWEVGQAAMMALVVEFPDAQRKISSIVSGNLESSVPARLQSIPLFKDFEQSFQMLMSLYCERRVYFPGERIAHGGRVGDGLYIINVGEADFERSGVRMMKLSAGSHFGSTIMLGIHKLFLGTVDALAVCHVLIITRESYLMALERYPAPTAAQALKKGELKSAEELQARMRRTVLKEQVMTTCQEALREKLGSKPRKSFAIKSGSPLSESLGEVFAVWREFAQEKASLRRRDKRQAGRWSWWVSGRQVAVDQRMQTERQALSHLCWRDEALPGPKDPATEHFSGAEQVRAPRWSRPLAPYAVDQGASARWPRKPQSLHLAPMVPGAPSDGGHAKAPMHDLEDILNAINERRMDDAALALARAKAPDGPAINLLGAAARAAAVAAAGLTD